MSKAITTGTYEVDVNLVRVNTGTAESPTWSPIANLTEFPFKISAASSSSSTFDSEGWEKTFGGAKSFSISAKAKRTIGDTGNDFIAGLAFKSSNECYADFQITSPDSTNDVVQFNGFVNVTDAGNGGKSGDPAALEFEIKGNGKPQITTSAAA